jgi:hypothetical protein
MDERGGGPRHPANTITTTADGVEKRRGVPSSQHTYQGAMKDADPIRHLSAKEQGQLALFRLLSSLTMYRRDLTKLITSQQLPPSSTFPLTNIVFDWPENEVELKALPQAFILADGSVPYSMPDLTTGIIEDTVDVFGEGTALRKISESLFQTTVHILCAHKEERRAVEGALERAFLAEPDDDQPGRRVVLPEYYDRTVRVMLQSTATPDDPQRAASNEWEIQAVFQIECEIVKLVTRPTYTRDPHVGVMIDPS